MGILDWLRKKKETPAEIAKRRISSLSGQQVTASTQSATSSAQEAPLPTLDPQAIEAAHGWSDASFQQQAEARPNPNEVKQKIIEKMGAAKKPQQRRWKSLEEVKAQSQQSMEQFSFDEVGVETDATAQASKKQDS